MTPARTPLTRDQHREVGARFLAATALAYTEHGLTIDFIRVDEDGLGETSGGVRSIDRDDAGRIGMVGQAIQLEWLIDSIGQEAALKQTLTNWQQAAEDGIPEEGLTATDGVLSSGSLLASAPWSVAFVAENRELITELTALLLASDGHLESTVFLPVVEGRIRAVTAEGHAAALGLLKPHMEQLEATAALVADLRK